MDEQIPAVPQPPPPVSKKGLYVTLGMPPVMTMVGAGLLVRILGGEGGALAGVMLTVFLLVALLAWTTAFSLVVGKRYRGTSQAFLVISYLLGQIIVCCSLWLGILLLPAYLGAP